MRTKQALRNTIMSLLLQLTQALSGIFLPRFFISIYGSDVNGLVSSVGQFITYMSLVEAGVGAAGTVALYRPLSEKSYSDVSEIISAAGKFYMRSGIIFAGLTAALTVFYPFAVKSEIQDATFIRTMIVLLSVNTVVDYFYLSKYGVLLTADQRGYVLSGIKAVGTIVMTGVSIWQMEQGASALTVKGTAALIYLLRSVTVGLYVRSHYPQVNFRARPRMEALGQRHAALLHQITGTITLSTDMVLLTLMLPSDALKEVSVYSVYNMVAYGISSLMTAISSALSAGFGEVISVGDTETTRQNFDSYEYLFFILIFAAYSCMLVLLAPFLSVYCADFSDGVVYARRELIVLFSLAGLVQTLRLPSLTLITAAGHFRQTRSRAVLEAVINLTVSLILIRPYGIAGVLIGTLSSYLYRCTDNIIYSAKQFTGKTVSRTFRRILLNLAVFAAAAVLGVRLVPQQAETWLGWLISAICYGAGVSATFFAVNYLAEPHEMKAVLKKITAAVKEE